MLWKPDKSVNIKGIKVKINNNIVRLSKFTNTASEFADFKMKDMHLESPKQSASSSSSALSSTLSHQSVKELLQCSEYSQGSDKEQSNSCESLSACSQSSKSRTPSPKREPRETKIPPTSKKKKGEQNPRTSWTQSCCRPSIAPLWRTCWLPAGCAVLEGNHRLPSAPPGAHLHVPLPQTPTIILDPPP